MNSKIAAIIVLVIVVAGGWLILRDSGTSTDTGSETMGAETGDDSTSAGEGSETAGNVKEFTVTGKPFSFAPNAITVNKGDTVKITFVNENGMHDWVLDEFNARTKQIGGGQSETVTFVADKAGTFEYYCSVGTHRQMGMVGTLTVI